MTNDDVRRIAALVSREVHKDVQIVVDIVRRLERDVADLKNDKLVREIREDERARLAAQAVENAAETAAKAAASRQWSVKKWTTIIGAVGVSVGAIGTLSSLLADYLK